MTDYVTIENDRLDKICKLQYGTERNGNVEMVLAANRGLAELGPILPAGVEIYLPEATAKTTTVNKSIRLWT